MAATLPVLAVAPRDTRNPTFVGVADEAGRAGHVGRCARARSLKIVERGRNV